MGWMVPERSMALCNSGLSLPVCSWVCASFRLYSNWIWIQHIYTILCFSIVCIVFCQYCNIISQIQNHVMYITLRLTRALPMPKEHQQQLLSPEEPGDMAVQDAQGVPSSHLLLWHCNKDGHNIAILCNKQTKQPLMIRLHCFSCTPLHSTKHDQASSFSKATSGSKAPAYLKTWEQRDHNMDLCTRKKSSKVWVNVLLPWFVSQ